MSKNNNENTQFQENIIKYTPGGMHICYLSDPIHLDYGSYGLCRMLGYTKEEFDVHSDGLYLRNIVEADHYIFKDFIMGLAENYGIDTCEYRMIKKDGSIIYVSDTMESMMCDDGIVRGYSSVTDITELKKAKEEYKNLYNTVLHANTRFHIITKFMGIFFFEFDVRDKEYKVIENLNEILYYTEESLYETIEKKRKVDHSVKHFGDLCYLVHDDDREKAESLAKELEASKDGRTEIRLLCGDGVYHWFRVEVHVSREDKNVFIGCMRNIDSRISELRMLEKRVILDPMTGLLNKVAAFECIDNYLKTENSRIGAFLFFDIDDFKQINDQLGHQVGDTVIKHVADIIEYAFEKDDITGRFGGDEFVVFMKNLESKESAYKRIEEIDMLFDTCDCLKNTGLKLSVSIGVAFSDNGSTAEELFLRADQKTYEVKKQRKKV